MQLGLKQFKEKLYSGALEASGKTMNLWTLQRYMENALAYAKEGEVIERCMYAVYPPKCVGVGDITLKGGEVFQWACGWCKTPLGWKQKECPMCKVEPGWGNAGGLAKWKPVRDQLRKEKGIEVSE